MSMLSMAVLTVLSKADGSLVDVGIPDGTEPDRAGSLLHPSVALLMSGVAQGHCKSYWRPGRFHSTALAGHTLAQNSN